jgi:cytochrome P450
MSAPAMPVHIRRSGFDPVAELGRLRTEQPVSRVSIPPGVQAWLVTRYHDVRQVLGDATRFSNRPGGYDSGGGGDIEIEHNGFLIAYDPPDHTRLRRLLTAGFTVARMRTLAPPVADVVRQQLDVMAGQGAQDDLVDLVEAFALPIPSLVICELLGVPYADRDEFQRTSRLRVDMSTAQDVQLAAAQTSRAYLTELITEQRRSPANGLIGMLLREHGDELTDDELVGVADLLLLAGHETTANMLGLGTCLLLQQPDQIAALRDPATVDGAVEELLRYLSVVNAVMPRTTLTEVTIGDTVIPAGEMIIVSLPAANRDPASGASDPDRPDLRRTVTSHVSFGHGIHHCIGAPLARLEIRMAYPALFNRFPGLRLAVGSEQIGFRPSSIVFGLEKLPVTW